MNPERAAIGNIDRRRETRRELSPTMANAYEKARNEVLSNPDYAILESDFAEVYSADTIAEDVALTERLEKKFESNQTPQEANAKKIADTLEAIVLMQSEMSNWLGDATTLKASRYDDFVNKTDMLAEWHSPEDGSRILALAVDVTFGKATMEKKLQAIKDEIDSGKLGSIKYFKDERGDFIGKRNNVPRLVIGMSQPVVEDLARLWLNNDTKALAAHPAQRVILDEIYIQLSAMLEYANRTGKPEAAMAYKQALATIQPVYRARMHIDSGALKQDPVRTELVATARNYFGTPEKKAA
ncbi:MAG TPA: hypothetical protein VHO23_01180 [Candidatus Paceibacterota bacterium]|nr:hypothetical protein [Candidatus Paceibacterota bacterium]